jgi:hypothetical protein
MMKNKSGYADRVLGVFMGVMGLICFFEASSLWSGLEGPGTMVVIVGVICIFTSIVFLFFPSRENKSMKLPNKKEISSMGVVGGSFALYIYFMDWVGYALGTWLFLAAVAKYISPTRLHIILIWTGAVAIATYIIFKKYLFLPLPAGFVGI